MTPTAHAITKFHVLQGTLPILVVSSTSKLRRYTDIFDRCPLLAVHHAGSVDMAIEMLSQSSRRFDFAVLDPHRRQRDCDLRILSAAASTVPCLVIAGSGTPAYGATCLKLGAIDVVDKGQLDSDTLLRVVSRQALRHRLIGFSGGCSWLAEAIEILLESPPEHVNEWAAAMGREESLLRRYCRIAGTRAKELLCLAQAFAGALDALGIRAQEQPSTDLTQQGLKAVEYIASRPHLVHALHSGIGPTDDSTKPGR